MTDLTGRTALVTGGSRGIGRAIVRRLAAYGAEVVFTYATDHNAASAVAAEVTADGGRAHPVRADLGVPTDVDGMFAAVDERFDALDVLVNNAGITSTTPLAELEEDEYDRVLAVNVKGPFLAVRRAIPRLRDGGRIINISSATTAWPSAGEAAYAASKAALEQLARVASRELGGRGITANNVSPGVTDTAMIRRAVPEAALDGVASMTPLGRLGTPDDVAAVVAYLTGPDSGWLTGQNLRADGGLI